MSSDNTHLLRIIDANANRAREGIRTAEDYCRYYLNDGRWSSRLKAVRRSISETIAANFADATLVASRDVDQDPLHPQADTIVSNTKAAELPVSVALRGLKRAQEALRVLEENLRATHGAASQQFANHRYSLYEAEQWLLCAGETAAIVNASNVYVLVTSSLCKNGLMRTTEQVLKGGVRLIQLREKTLPQLNALIAQARDLLKLCKDYNAVVICNDRLDLALAAGMKGVHLGQNDLPPVDARRIAGERILIGRSTHSVQQAKLAVEVEQTDYIAIGSMYDTATKPERILAGLALAEQVAALDLKVPVFAIGGITLDRVKELKSAGVKRIAVSTAIIGDAEPESAARRFIEAMA